VVVLALIVKMLTTLEKDGKQANTWTSLFRT
jgi:hypothetical protein